MIFYTVASALLVYKCYIKLTSFAAQIFSIFVWGSDKK